MKSFGNIAKDGQVRAVASGALTDGTAVIVNSNGTVSVVAETSISQSVGSLAAFHESNTQTISSTYDANTNRVVVVYSDPGDSDKGKAIVGTISGTSISFGSEVVFDSGVIGEKTVIYDSASQKVVIAFRDAGNNNYGTAIVGTVSGTSISFGSKTVFQSSIAIEISSTFDSASNKVVIAFSDQDNSYYGKVVVGTVSGTSISFGSAVVWNSDRTDFNSIAFDSSANKVVIPFSSATGSPSYEGKAIVGTVSGTSISFGSAVVFESGRTESTSIVYDTNAGKVVIAYKDKGNNSYATAIVGTVSGTSISFGTAVVFDSNNSDLFSTAFNASNNTVLIAYKPINRGYIIAGTVSGTSISFATRFEFLADNSLDGISLNYNSTEEKSVISFRNYGNNYGTSIVYTGSGTETNITSENFIGFSDGAFATTQSAAINTTNTIDRNQSGLTAGQTYFVQTDGTLGTTAASPSVTAGTAISATELIVKG